MCCEIFPQCLLCVCVWQGWRGDATQLVGSQFPKPRPQQWKPGILTTRLPGNSLSVLILKRVYHDCTWNFVKCCCWICWDDQVERLYWLSSKLRQAETLEYSGELGLLESLWGNSWKSGAIKVEVVVAEIQSKPSEWLDWQVSSALKKMKTESLYTLADPTWKRRVFSEVSRCPTRNATLLTHQTLLSSFLVFQFQNLLGWQLSEPPQQALGASF